MIAVVWFKRDLRVFDHQPLQHASLHAAVLPLYVYEPDIISAPDYATQHLGFTNECLADLDTALKARGSALLTLQGEMTAVLQRIFDTCGIFALYSHEETGNAISYARDLRVAAWCHQHGVRWRETPTNGVVRRLGSRDDWARIWAQRMQQATVPAPDRLPAPTTSLASCGLLTPQQLGLSQADKPDRQRGGRKRAVLQLRHFFTTQLPHYRAAMSSPLSADRACSRLSPYLSFGVLSVREVVQQVWKRRARLRAVPEAASPGGALAGLKAFESRLHWHCHFIQKLESEPAIETTNMHRGFDGVREPHFNADYFVRWRDGQTGFPLIDASMAMLAETGWINFRMRALLISFSSYQCWNHWREPALHLAREFLDYEPGIHYAQIQMQSGVTGINTLRIYNPVKQAQDQDPQGIFVKRWLPSLRKIPTEFIFEPWTMPTTLQRDLGIHIGSTYPAPLCDHLVAARHARDVLWTLRGEPAIRKEAQQVFNKHGSRNPARTGRRRPKKTVTADSRAEATQLPLNLE